MPPVRDLIPAEGGDEEDSDDDLEIGGVSQNFRCPLTTNLLEDPLTKYVLKSSNLVLWLFVTDSSFIAPMSLQYQLHTFIHPQRNHGIRRSRQQSLSRLVMHRYSHTTNSQAGHSTQQKSGRFQEKGRRASHGSTPNFNCIVLVSLAYTQAKIRVQDTHISHRARLMTDLCVWESFEIDSVCKTCGGQGNKGANRKEIERCKNLSNSAHDQLTSSIRLGPHGQLHRHSLSSGESHPASCQRLHRFTGCRYCT